MVKPIRKETAEKAALVVKSPRGEVSERVTSSRAEPAERCKELGAGFIPAAGAAARPRQPDPPARSAARQLEPWHGRPSSTNVLLHAAELSLQSQASVGHSGKELLPAKRSHLRFSLQLN